MNKTNISASSDNGWPSKMRDLSFFRLLSEPMRSSNLRLEARWCTWESAGEVPVAPRVLTCPYVGSDSSEQSILWFCCCFANVFVPTVFYTYPLHVGEYGFSSQSPCSSSELSIYSSSSSSTFSSSIWLANIAGTWLGELKSWLLWLLKLFAHFRPRCQKRSHPRSMMSCDSEM